MEDRADFDDEDSDDEVDSDGSSEKNNDGAISSHNKEKIEESPTVTDQSSSDGSHKRDFESSQTENSDYENECGKETDQSSQGFTIPKKSNEATKKASIVVPKNVIPKKVQSSVTSGTSLISDAARQAMIDKKMAKKTSNNYGLVNIFLIQHCIIIKTSSCHNPPSRTPRTLIIFLEF